MLQKFQLLFGSGSTQMSATSLCVARRAEDTKARDQCSQEPEWWGAGLKQEVEDFFRREVGTTLVPSK